METTVREYRFRCAGCGVEGSSVATLFLPEGVGDEGPTAQFHKLHSVMRPDCTNFAPTFTRTERTEIAPDTRPTLQEALEAERKKALLIFAPPAQVQSGDLPKM